MPPKPQPQSGSPPPEKEKEEPILSSPETTVVVIANSRFVQDTTLQRLGASNLVFLLNLVDWISLGDELIGIRSRPVIEHPLKEISDSSKRAIKYLNILGMSFLIIVFGLIRYSIRRQRLKVAT